MYQEYKVITDYSLVHLEDTINTKLRQGWQLVGGISVTLYINNPDGKKEEDFDVMMYAQAIAK